MCKVYRETENGAAFLLFVEHLRSVTGDEHRVMRSPASLAGAAWKPVLPDKSAGDRRRVNGGQRQPLMIEEECVAFPIELLQGFLPFNALLFKVLVFFVGSNDDGIRNADKGDRERNAKNDAKGISKNFCEKRSLFLLWLCVLD